VITDTVGSSANLPSELARAFRATLEEMADADLLLHIVDAAIPIAISRSRCRRILADLRLATRRILVWTSRQARGGDAEHSHHGRRLVVSALDALPFGPLRSASERSLWQQGKQRRSPAGPR